MDLFITPITPMEPLGSNEQTKPVSKSSIPFQNVLNNALSSYADLSAQSTADGYGLALGNVDNLSQLQINSLKTNAMLQTTVQLTTRMVNAYKEIMQMQV